MQGGESRALARLQDQLKDKAWVAQFEKPKGNPAALEPCTTVLSPYMKFGCISSRLFYAKLAQVLPLAHSMLWTAVSGALGNGVHPLLSKFDMTNH